MMKKLVLIMIAILSFGWLSAQNTERVVRVHDNGGVVFQLPTSQMDSIKSEDVNAIFHFGDGSWSRNIHNIDSMTFAYVPASDTTVILDTTAVDTANAIRIHWENDTVSVQNPYATSGVDITVSNQKVDVVAAAGVSNLVYILSGTSTNAYFHINTDKKFIMLLNGVSLAAQDKPAVNIKDNKKCVVHLADGTVNVFTDDANNNGKSCFYSKGELVLQGNGTLQVVSVSVNGFQGKGGVEVLNGNSTINVSAATAKGIKTDGNVVFNGGTMNITASGTLTIDTLTDGTYDKSYSSGIKPDGDFVMNGGNLTITLPASNAGGKCISTTGNTIINGGYLTMSTAGDGACLGGTGQNATDGYVNSCIKSDSNIYIMGGHITATSTGIGGRGICGDGHLYIGQEDASNDRLFVYVQTSGATTNNVDGGGGWPGWPPGGGNTGDDDYFKGIAKGIRMEGNIYIYSGHVQAYCSQTSGDPTGEAIESKDSIFIYGGDVEANAYDDAINAAQYLEVRGGRVWAYSRGNDGIDCNGNTNIYGGLLLVKGNEVGIDAATDAGGHFSIYGGTIITQGGTMGAWDTPNGSSTQRWISISSANSGNNGLLVKNNQGDTLLVYKNSTFTGNGFLNVTRGHGDVNPGNGTKPPGGGGGSGTIVFSCPQISQGQSYTVYKSATVTGGSNWHGFYTDASATGTGTVSTVNAQ